MEGPKSTAVMGGAAPGFSLVEVIVALGILAGVLVSVAGMFVVGNRQVVSGRNATEALAVARGMIEEMQGWGFHQTHALFLDPLCNPAGDATCAVDTAANPAAAKWQSQIETTLGQGHAEVRFESVGGGPLADARAIRLRVTVFWTEGERARRIDVATVRM